MKKDLRVRLSWALVFVSVSAATLGAAVIPALAEGQSPFVLSSSEYAQQSRPSGGRPPREALEACAEKKSGASCSFDAREGSVTGTCQSPEANVPAACVPEGAGPKG